MKGVKFLNDETVNCCETCDPSEIPDEQGINRVTEILEQNRHLKVEKRLLEDLLVSKDDIISGLKEEIHLLKENIMLLRQLNSVKIGNVDCDVSEGDVLSVDKKIQKKKTKKTDDSDSKNNSNKHKFTINETDGIIKKVNNDILVTKQIEKMNEIMTLKDPNETPTGDTDGFKLVQYKHAKRIDSSGNNYRKQSDRNRFNITVGTKTPDENSVFKARPSKMWIYVGKVNEGVKSETVKKYIKDKCSVANDGDLVVEELPTAGRSPAFRVGVDNKYYEQLKLPDFWPSGIIIRRYNFRVNKTKPTEEGSGRSTAGFLGVQN